MPLRLPPLNSLRIFEAAARQGNFSLAARELNLTPSAVSHAMQMLEQWLGTALFLRGPRGLRLSDAGAAYLPAVAGALRELASASERLPGRKPSGQLAISSAFTFAHRFLLPRLGEFRQRHPEIKLTINTSRRLVDLPLDGVDLAIRMAPVGAGLPHWMLLFEETLVPVCSPHLCGDIDVFRRAPLIRVTSVTSDWDAWFAQSGVAPPTSAALQVDTIEMALEAAAQGLGIAVGREPLVAPQIANGRLVRTGAPVNSGTGYWMIAAEADFEKPEVGHFRRWLQAEAAQLAAGKIQKASRGNST
jgi:LysR family glycine cleavage system transcriptional activator